MSWTERYFKKHTTMIAFRDLLRGPYFSSKGAHLPTCPSSLLHYDWVYCLRCIQDKATRTTYPYTLQSTGTLDYCTPTQQVSSADWKTPPGASTQRLIRNYKSLPVLFSPIVSIVTRPSSSLRQRFFDYLHLTVLPFKSTQYLSILLRDPAYICMTNSYNAGVYATTTKELY